MKSNFETLQASPSLEDFARTGSVPLAKAQLADVSAGPQFYGGAKLGVGALGGHQCANSEAGHEWPGSYVRSLSRFVNCTIVVAAAV